MKLTSHPAPCVCLRRGGAECGQCSHPELPFGLELGREASGKFPGCRSPARASERLQLPQILPPSLTNCSFSSQCLLMYLHNLPSPVCTRALSHPPHNCMHLKLFWKRTTLMSSLRPRIPYLETSCCIKSLLRSVYIVALRTSR
jgi:hypothetical protein